MAWATGWSPVREGLRRVWPAGVRARTAILAALVVTVALIAGAIALVAITRSSLTDSARDRAVAKAEAVAELARAGAVEAELPGTGDVLAQLIDDSGAVIAATRNIDFGGPLSGEPARGGLVVETVAEIEQGESELVLDGFDGPFVVAVIPTQLDGSPAQAVAVASLAAVDRTTSTLVPLLVVGVPLLAGLVALTSWHLVGRSFRPIESMRAEAESISLSDLDRRIPAPASQDEIRRLADTLNRMLARLEHAVAQQRRFVADASHELKSPVAALVTMAEVAAANPDSVPVRALARDLGVEAGRLALLVDDLLTLAGYDEGRVELRREDTDLAAIVAEEAAAAGDGLDVDTAGVRPLRASVDRRRMGQAVRNLVDNAKRHARSRVWVLTEGDRGRAIITVADDGPGVPPEDRERVFERFERLDEGRSRDEGGTGLGLAVVRAIAEAHHGSVSIVEDDRFPGAVFRLWIPT